jgi:hypothetical protein
MAVRGPGSDGGRMPQPLRSHPELASGVYQLQRAAGAVLLDASAPDAVSALPVTLTHLEEVLDRLSTSMVKTAQAVEEWPGAAEADTATLSSEARALRWHLFHLAARLRDAQHACPDTRHWGRELLHDPLRDPATPTSARRESVS